MGAGHWLEVTGGEDQGWVIGAWVRISHWTVNLSPGTPAVIHQREEWMGWDGVLDSRVPSLIPQPGQASVFSQKFHLNSLRSYRASQAPCLLWALCPFYLRLRIF